MAAASCTAPLCRALSGHPGSSVNHCSLRMLSTLLSTRSISCSARPGQHWGQAAGTGFFSLRPSLPIRRMLLRAKEEGHAGEGRRDQGLDDYVEVKVDSVRVSTASAIVFLRVLDGQNLVLPVHIGEAESNALLKEINKQRQVRPLTHDVAKSMLMALGYRVTKIRITDIVANTYYARIHLAKMNAQGGVESEEVDVDARPSDAINLAARFGAPMYVNKRIAEIATQPHTEVYSGQGSESQAEIIRSVRDTLASFEDPTVMYQLQKEIAIKDQRYEDARVFQQNIYYEMTHDVKLRLIVAMEAALKDERFEEAARLRDEYKRVVAAGQHGVQQQTQSSSATSEKRM